VSFDDYPFDPAVMAAEPTGYAYDPTRHCASHLIHLSKQHLPIRALLIQAGLISIHDARSQILAWNELYKMLDTMRHVSKRHGWAESMFAVPADLEKFTAACNNMSVLGINARHGLAGNAAPTRVITNIGDATSLIFGMATAFCSKYMSDVVGPVTPAGPSPSN
jgi:hypothetical protein